MVVVIPVLGIGTENVLQGWDRPVEMLSIDGGEVLQDGEQFSDDDIAGWRSPQHGTAPQVAVNVLVIVTKRISHQPNASNNNLGPTQVCVSGIRRQPSVGKCSRDRGSTSQCILVITTYKLW